MLRRLVPGPGQGTRHVLRTGRFAHPDRVVASQFVEPMAGQERRQGQMTAILLTDDHHQRRAVDPGSRQRADAVTQPGCRVQDDDRRLLVGDRPAGGDADHRTLVQREHKVQIFREVGEQGNLGRPGIGKKGGSAEAAEHVE